MDTRTGIMDFSGSGKDLIELYEKRTSGPTVTTHYVSQTYGQDLGSIFYMNANLGGLGLAGINGANCGHKFINGTDIGSMFCAKGTVFISPFVGVVNGNFNASTTGLTLTGSYITASSGTTAAFPWVTNATTASNQNLFVSNENTYYTTPLTIPKSLTNFICFQSNTTAANNPFYISQNIYFSSGSYILSFYAIGRKGGYYNQSATSMTISVNSIDIGTLPGPSTTAWFLYSISFTISTAGVFPIKLTYSSSVTADSMLCVTGINITPNYVYNGCFSSPIIALNTYAFDNSVTISNWTKVPANRMGLCIGNNNGNFNCATLPTQQYFAIQFYQFTGTVYVYQTLTLPSGNYTLSFYSWPRQAFFNTSISLSAYIGATNLTPTALTYTAGSDAVLTTRTFTIDTLGNYDLKFSSTNNVNGDTALCFSNVSVVASGFLSSIPTGCVGLFACKWVNSSYAGPILKIRNGATQATANFYMNSTGTAIGTAVNGAGTLLTTWLNGATAYVDTWYDQSGAGRHATQATTTTQPTFDTTNKCINFAVNTNSYLNLPDGTVPYNNSSYSIITKHGTISNTQGVFVSCNAYDFRLNGNYRYEGPTLTALNGGTYAINNIVSIQYDKPNTNLNIYVNGTASGTQSEPINASASASTFNIIGSINNGTGFGNIANNSLNGQMFYMSIFNSLLISADRVIMEGI